MKPTSEQELIIQSKARTLVVKAWAGTGKTSTLVMYAQANPNLRMTLLTFNAAIKKEAQERFPSNVKCMTAHGVAFSKFGRTYSDVPNKLNNPRPFHLSQALGLTHRDADLTLKVLNEFMASVDKRIEAHHAAKFVGSQDVIDGLVKVAEQAWMMMKNPHDSRVPMPHDGYLKLYQISGDVITSDVILFDEAQDASPIMQDIVSRSPGRKVYVGDENQAIYGFRGAVNAMQDIVADEELYLSASFRFGAGVAILANAILNEYRKMPKPLQGLGKAQSLFTVDVKKPHTRLSRTNAQLFSEAISAVNSGRKFAFVGGVNGYNFDSLKCVYYLKDKQPNIVKDPVIRRFKTYQELVNYAEAVDDKELKSKIKVVDDYDFAVVNYVDKVKALALDDLSKADIIMSTAHKAKGLEWDSVFLTNDFTDMLPSTDENGKTSPPDDEEINLLYVSVTRAKRCISVHEGLHQWLEQIGFYEPVTQTITSIPKAA